MRRSIPATPAAADHMRGEVGINTAVIEPGEGNVGIGLAIPSNDARQVMDAILTSPGDGAVAFS